MKSFEDKLHEDCPALAAFEAKRLAKLNEAFLKTAPAPKPAVKPAAPPAAGTPPSPQPAAAAPQGFSPLPQGIPKEDPIVWRAEDQPNDPNHFKSLDDAIGKAPPIGHSPTEQQQLASAIGRLWRDSDGIVQGLKKVNEVFTQLMPSLGPEVSNFLSASLGQVFGIIQEKARDIRGVAVELKQMMGNMLKAGHGDKDFRQMHADLKARNPAGYMDDLEGDVIDARK